MSRPQDSGRLDLAEVFLRAQEEMLAQLAMGGLIEHAPTAGATTERQWLALFERYLPKRYRAASVFVIDSRGHRSRQIDLAIYDNFYSPPLFPNEGSVHIPAESVYAVFEVKPAISRVTLRDAGEKVASVRALHRTSAPVISGGVRRSAIRPGRILGGILAGSSVWSEETFDRNIRYAARENEGDRRIDLGCSLEHGAFDYGRKIAVSGAEESLIFFILHLFERLQAMGTAPAADLMKYGRSLRSFQPASARKKRSRE
jgi:hypothetical protein